MTQPPNEGSKDTLVERDETTFDEVVHRLREGQFYDDYDWASGPALRALTRAAARIEALERAIQDALDDLNTPGHLGGHSGSNNIARKLRQALSLPTQPGGGES